MARKDTTPRDRSFRRADADLDTSARHAADRDAGVADTEEANPPHTTRGKITSPKFGSAGSGGLEYEGNFDRD